MRRALSKEGEGGEEGGKEEGGAGEGDRMEEEGGREEQKRHGRPSRSHMIRPQERQLEMRRCSEAWQEHG